MKEQHESGVPERGGSSVKIRVDLDLTPEEFQVLWRKASSRMPDTREDTSKRWTDKEKQEVVRRYVRLLVSNSFC